MIRRTLIVTAIAVALTVAGSLAVRPSFARSSHRWSIVPWARSGFTPAAPARDTSAVSRASALTQADVGIPGTYCPIRPRDSSRVAKSRSAVDPTLDLGVSGSRQSKIDSAVSAAATMCPIPSGSATKAILP